MKLEIENYSYYGQVFLITCLLICLALLSNYTSIYVIQILAVIGVFFIANNNELKVGRFTLTALVTLLFIEYDMELVVRLYYFLVIAALLLLLPHVTRISKVSYFSSFFWSFFIVFSICWLVFDDTLFKLYNIKSWLFYVGLIYVIVTLTFFESFDFLLRLFISLSTSVYLLSIFQFACGFIFGVDSNPLYPPLPNLEVRP